MVSNAMIFSQNATFVVKFVKILSRKKKELASTELSVINEIHSLQNCHRVVLDQIPLAKYHLKLEVYR